MELKNFLPNLMPILALNLNKMDKKMDDRYLFQGVKRSKLTYISYVSIVMKNGTKKLFTKFPFHLLYYIKIPL